MNYYPVAAAKTALNDLNVGSVVRTLLETVSFELGVVYQHLDFIYKSAFLDTAEGQSLDKVVALVGVTRLASGHAVAKLKFERRAGDTGRVVIPGGTVITDDKGNRYLTEQELILEPGESSREVMASGETPATPEVDAGKLDRLEVLVAGVDKVSNEQPARRLSQAETDDELRRRARAAFHGVVRGTLDALKFHLLSLPEVKDVAITEEPNGVPGEVKIDVAYNQDTPEARAKVDERVRQVKPAGIRVVTGSAARRKVSVRVQLTLAGTGLSGSDLTALKSTLQDKLVAALNALPPGGTVRRAKLTALMMEDARIVDAAVFMTPEGGAEVEELNLAAGEVIAVNTPIQFSEPATEQAVTTTVDVDVSAVLPIHLTPGTTEAQATAAIDSAFTSYLAARASDQPLTVDGVAAAIRDDSRFALVRSDAIVTVESGDRFFQLTDGVGSYAPAPSERLRKKTLGVDVREGGRMKRADDMAARLPPLYREGELVSAILTQPALQIEIVEEYLLDIQRAHQFDAALEFTDAAKLATVLDFTPEPWQNLVLFRAWVHSQRDAALDHGAVTADSIRGFVESYADAYQAAINTHFQDDHPALVENPPRRRSMRPPLDDNIVPLSQFSIVNGGLDETPVSFLLTGLAGGPESAPVIVNLTTGEAILFLGNVGPGERLWLRAGADGTLQAQLERRDVSDRLRFIPNVVPGEAWGRDDVQTPARALRLMRGENKLWFLPVAHYDVLGLDRFLLALADLALAQGHWDAARLDHSVFYQDAAVSLTASWIEDEPASIEVHVPLQSVRRSPLAPGTPSDARDQLTGAIDLGVKRLKAAGVRSEIRSLTFSEMQGQSDFFTGVLPLRLKEAGSSGADRMPDAGGLFTVTGFGDSTFR